MFIKGLFHFLLICISCLLIILGIYSEICSAHEEQIKDITGHIYVTRFC
jgi:hypothetical protein